MPIQKRDLHHNWSLVCERALIDQKTNLLTIFNVIEEVTLSDLKKNGAPVGPSELKEEDKKIMQRDMCLLSAWRRDQLAGEEALEHDLKIEWISPAGNVLMQTESKINLEKGKNNLRVLINLDKIAFTTAGTYVFRLSDKNEKNVFKSVTEIPIDFKVAG